MKKRNLEKIVRGEFGNIDTTVNICPQKSNEFNVNCYGDSLNFDFNIDFEDKSMVFAYLNVDEDSRGYGYGRKLVEAGENVARHCGIGTGYILNNINRQFWDYMGYKRNIKIYNENVVNAYSLIYNATKDSKIRDITIELYDDKYEIHINNKKTYSMRISKDLKEIEYDANKGLIRKIRKYIKLRGI